MLVIRLKRVGKKNQPSFRIVVTEKKNSAKGGVRVEKLGSFNPLTKKASLNKERILYWISKGAKVSDTVHNLLVKNKVLEGKKIAVHKKSKKKQEGTAPASQDTKAASVESKPAEPQPVPTAPKTEESKPALKAEPVPANPEKPAEAQKEVPVQPPADQTEKTQ